MGNHYPSTIYLLIHWAVAGIALIITSKIIAGFKISDFKIALIAAILIGIANAVIWPVLIVLTLPINILTLGFFTFVVNGAVLKICASLMPGFEIESWWSAIFGAIVLSLVSTVLHFFLV